MRAAVLEYPDKNVKIYDDVEIIDPRAGEVRVKVHYCGLCHSDLSVVDQIFASEDPIVLGHEAAGVVEKVGAGVSHLKPGDKVILTPAPSCGRCYYCQRNQHSLCVEVLGLMTMTLPDGETGLSRRGKKLLRGVNVAAFAEYVLTTANGAIKVPDDTALDTACVMGCAVQTGVGAVLNIAEMEEGATTLIMGLGGIGQSAVQGARLSAAEKIIVSDPDLSRRELAKQLGATDTIDPLSEDVAARCRDLTGGIGVDYAFETAGVKDLAATGLDALRMGGHLVCVGAPPLEAELNLSPLALFVTTQKRVSGCLLGGCNSHYEIPRLTGLWRQGKLDFDSMITMRRPLSEINEALDDMRNKKGLRTILEVSPN